MTEFLVEMATTVPDATTAAEVDAMQAREAARHGDAADRPPQRPG
jgi:muconolactone delta-isomerase